MEFFYIMVEDSWNVSGWNEPLLTSTERRKPAGDGSEQVEHAYFFIQGEFGQTTFFFINMGNVNRI